MLTTNPTTKNAPPQAATARKALCIHGHFYQPPRENPLTGEIPQEAGAAPYHNWNERIHAECYQPNARLGNFERISFNVGPTLFRWMERHDPITYRRILAQDACNVNRYGVGNALAQAYNHTILPLASRRDKVTQISWGLADFEQRFKRKARGMWLPETAADTQTLQVLAQLGVEFTILAPWQADTEHIDPTEPYWVPLPDGQRMAVFFYHASLSGGISFNQSLTHNAHEFALHNLSDQFRPEKSRAGKPQLLMVASDGELYGHHQRFRDWFLAYLVNGAGARAGIELTYPARWLQEQPPEREMGICEGTSWSCHHGVARWNEGCDCTPGDWSWKAPLRRALDQLAAALDSVYAQAATAAGLDPWELRNAYSAVLLKQRSTAELLACRKAIPRKTVQQIGLLLQAQEQRQAMFTSCGWFFGKFERLEPRNNLAYAAQAVRLTRQATGVDLREPTLAALRQVTGQNGLRGDQVFAENWQALSHEK